ncbi:ankyrin repeat domain-containing protein [Pseudomonas frederiksbergensis]|nr:ankyrin repeat domain-containing protein [Pseudomonas frederiksbergensis]
MAGDEENKKTLLRFSPLDADRQQSLWRFYGYGNRGNESRETLLQMLREERKRRNDVPLPQDAETDAVRIASRKKHEEQMFIRDVKDGNILSIKFAIQSRTDVNAQDKFGMTALHYAAATGFRPCIRLLVNSGLCNYLLKDNKGRLASELAYEWGKDYAVGLLLQKKEVRQAYEENRSPPATSGDDAP